MISLPSVRKMAAGAVGAGALTGAMLFASVPAAQAAPAPAPSSSFAVAGPHGPDVIPTRGGPGGGGGHFGGGGGRGGDWGHGDRDRDGWGHGDRDRDGWGHGGWGRGGWGNNGW